MKHRWVLLITVCLLAIAWIFASDKKGMAIHHLMRNEQIVTSHALSCMEEPDQTSRYQNWKTRYSAEYDVVRFQVSYTGFASQTDALGFYYSPQDEPNGLGNTQGIEETDSGIKFLGEGDNYTLVEKISDHWYWYEMHW